MNIVVAGGIDIPAKEQFLYWEFVKAMLEAEHLDLNQLVLRVNPDDVDRVDISYTLHPVKMENLPRLNATRKFK